MPPVQHMSIHKLNFKLMRVTQSIATQLTWCFLTFRKHDGTQPINISLYNVFFSPHLYCCTTYFLIKSNEVTSMKFTF